MKPANLRTAEWILSLVLPPDRAAAVIGDCLEDANQRGAFWFSGCVFRTAGSRVWIDLTRNPDEMSRLGLSGFGRNAVVIIGCLALLFAPFPVTDKTSWFLTNTAAPLAPPHLELRWLIQLAWFLVYAARLFRTARWMARRAPGREIAGFAAIALSGWIAIVAWIIIAPAIGVTTSATELSRIDLEHDAILFSCVVWTQRRFRRTTPMG